MGDTPAWTTGSSPVVTIRMIPLPTGEREIGSPHRRLLHRELGFQVVEIAIDRRHREYAAGAAIAQQTILGFDVALDRNRIPLLRVANISNRHVVVLAPEERHRVEALVEPEHVERRGLALALSHHPVLDPDAPAAIPIRPPADIGGGMSSPRAGLH